MKQHQISLTLSVGQRTVTVCRFTRYPIVENRKVVGYGDWQVTHAPVRVRTVESEADGMREWFSDPRAAARAKGAEMVVLKTDTRFEFWDVAGETLLFAVGCDKLAKVLDAFAAAGQHSIDLATLRAALERIGS